MQEINKNLKKRSLLLAFLLNTILAAQSSPWDAFEYLIGTSTFNQLGYGGYSTNDGSHFEDAYTTIPSLGLAYHFNPKYSLALHFQYSWLMSERHTSENLGFIENTTTSWCLAGYRNWGDLHLGLTLTGVQFSVFPNSIHRNYNFWDRLGPGLSLGYSFGNTSIFLNKDLFYDFSNWTQTFHEDYLNLRVLKHFPVKKGPAEWAPKKVPSSLLSFEISFGGETYIDHHFGKLLSPAVFSDLELKWGPWGIFTKRSLTIDWQSTQINHSLYTVSSNSGIRFHLNPFSSFGLSYFAARDNYQRRLMKLSGIEDPNGLFFIRGLSVHYGYNFSKHWNLSTQLDYLHEGLVDQSLSFFPKLGLRAGIAYRII